MGLEELGLEVFSSYLIQRDCKPRRCYYNNGSFLAARARLNSPLACSGFVRSNFAKRNKRLLAVYFLWRARPRCFSFLPKMNRHLLRTLLKTFQSRLKVMQILKVRLLKSCLHRLVRVRADMLLFHIVRNSHINSFVKLD